LIYYLTKTIMTTLKDYTTATEEKYNVGGNRESSGWYLFTLTNEKEKKGIHRVRLLTFPSVLVQHYSKGGYIGVCIGKGDNCPGCMKDEQIKQQKEQDPEGTKDLRHTRNIKHLAWVVDYGAINRVEKDPQHFEEVCKLAPIPHTVIKEIQKLQDDPEYAFGDFPMPYDVTIERDDNEQITKYSVRPARQNAELPQKVQDKLKDLTPPEEIVEKMKDKKRKELGEGTKQPEYPTTESEEIKPEDIPF
jgi:hypothetical protein